jgi:hypothetical protein
MNNAPSTEAGRTNPKTEEKAQANEYFQKAHRVSQPYRMRQNQMGKQGPVEAHRSSVDVTPEVSLKTAVGEAGTGQLVFANEQEEYSRGHARASDGLGRSR